MEGDDDICCDDDDHIGGFEVEGSWFIFFFFHLIKNEINDIGGV